MHRLIAGAGVALLVAACQADTPGSGTEAEPAVDTAARADTVAPDAPAVLTPEGWGPIRIGMTRGEVVAAAGEDANPDLVGGPDPEHCDQFRPERAPAGMLLMFEEGRLTRITVSRDSEVRTDRGFGLGDSAAAIRAAYGAAASSGLHKYLPAPAEYITVWTTDPDGPNPRGVVYETGVDTRVAHIHAGGSSIMYVEGCL